MRQVLFELLTSFASAEADPTSLSDNGFVSDKVEMNQLRLLLLFIKRRVNCISNIFDQILVRVSLRNDRPIVDGPMRLRIETSINPIFLHDKDNFVHCVMTSISPWCSFLLIISATCSACFRSLHTIANSPRPCLPFQTIHLWPRPLATRTLPRFFGIRYVAITQAFAVAISS